MQIVPSLARRMPAFLFFGAHSQVLGMRDTRHSHAFWLTCQIISLVCASFIGTSFRSCHSVLSALLILLLYESTKRLSDSNILPITCTAITIVCCSFPLHLLRRPFPLSLLGSFDPFTRKHFVLASARAFFTPLMNFLLLNTEYTNSMLKWCPAIWIKYPKDCCNFSRG